jgi:RNA-directed DNA polymerase
MGKLAAPARPCLISLNHSFTLDFIVGFEYRPEAEQFLAELRERFAKFGLDLHPDKTRIIEFGRYAERDRGSRGDGKPATFNFLGFRHSCGKCPSHTGRIHIPICERRRRKVVAQK